MKLACCQFEPKWGACQENITKANQLLVKYKAGDIDVLVLPEMAFTGYVFKSLQEITPYLEDAETGQTTTWAKQQAIRLKCFVLAGYPEVIKEDGQTKHYNSQCCVNQEGKLVYTYRKHFLYQVDENWAAEGPGFTSVDIKGLGKVGFGICMDLNPYRFEAPFDAFEFATYHAQQGTKLILCSMAWLQSKGKSENIRVRSTISYWAERLYPLINPPKTKDSSPVYFVACNRTGTERGNTFAGGSCVLELFPQCLIHDRLLEDDQDVLVVDTSKD
ncbi:carbon-nitrogen hydrolase [Phycomyces blakesleeanus]|uniref:Carbon-nitrogen hydrolase n=1 Tax=Phycomyces blakesleeanus TaxID=4837 RepID=A0ABR3ARE8_PHYBL